jgi:hypothetical protein
MLFLRIFAGFIIWTCILAYFVGIIGLGYYSYIKSTEIKKYLLTNSESGNNTKNN